MELSKRLQAVADLLDYHDRIADIGCDHGFVSIYLVENRKAARCLAMDVNKGPLERAREHIQEKRLSTYIETRLSNGAEKIDFIEVNDEKRLEVDAALIAGMGGRLMIRIIQDSLEKFQSMDEFVLQPQSEIAKVRQYIREIGYHIAKEDMVLEEGKFYPMMKVVKGSREKVIPDFLQRNHLPDNTELQKLYDEYGESLLNDRHPVLLQFLKKEKELYQEILENLLKMDTLKSEIRQKEITDKLKYIQWGLEWFWNEV